MSWRLPQYSPIRERSTASEIQQQLPEVAESDEGGGRHPPFASVERVSVVLPVDPGDLDDRSRAGLLGMRALFEENRPSFEAELGAEFCFASEDPGEGPRWLIGPTRFNRSLQQLGAARLDHPELRFDRSRSLLIADAPTVPDIFEAFSLLRNLCRGEADVLRPRECPTPEEAVVRIALEVADTWPSFERYGLDWFEVGMRHADAVLAAENPMAAMQAWLAELGDAHTWLRPAGAQVGPSFDAIVRDGELVVTRVVDEGPAWRAGLRAGDQLLGQSVREWWQRTAATYHQKPQLAALRMLQGPPGTRRGFDALKPNGRKISWQEELGAGPSEPLISSRRLPSGAGYLRIRAFVPSTENQAAIDEAMERFTGAPGLVVDLRGNTGGNGQMAHAFRDRFLRAETHMGYVQFSEPGGELGQRVPIHATPSPPAQRWNGPVRFLTDPLTYSAAENALLGLQGPHHVKVLGMPSGGGSGQARTVRIFRDANLTVSSCLTFDRNGMCIEGVGIPVDHQIAMRENFDEWTQVLLSLADASW